MMLLTQFVFTMLAFFVASQETPDTTTDKLLCMADMVQKIETSCQQPEIQGHYVALENMLKEYLGNCFQANFSETAALNVMYPSLTAGVETYLKEVATAYKGFSEVEVVPTYIPSDQINEEIEFELEHNLTNSHDGWIFDPNGIPSIYNLNGFVDLTKLVPNSSTLMWDDVLPFYKKVSSVYDNKVVTLPLDGNIVVFYYRQDLFDSNGISVPQTWDDVVSIATTHRTLNTDGNTGTLDYPICLERRKSCDQQSYDLMTIAASIFQYQGLSQGIYFDPTLIGTTSDMQALVNNAGMQAALTIYAQLLNMSPPASIFDTCDDTWSPDVWFAEGRCLMTFGTGSVFKAVAASNGMVVGNLGVSLVPGSNMVYNRTSQQLVSCNTGACSYATSSTSDSNMINRTPFAAAGGWVSGLSERSVALNQNNSYAFFSYLASPNSSWELVLNTSNDFYPYRSQHFSNISKWLDYGYNEADTVQYLGASLSALSHLNIALDLRVPNADDYRLVYTDAAANLTENGNASAIPSIMAEMQVGIMSIILNSQITNLVTFASSYRTSIQYGTYVTLPTPQSTSSGSPTWLPIAIVLPTVSALLLLAAAVVYQVRNSRKHKNLFGKVLPPGPGPDTTIIVTEVQDSNSLWESLPSEVMDQAVKVHHDCIRRILVKHSGYESSMEVDSCVLAFHAPKDAILFTMEAQLALLNVDWPPELLTLPVTQPIFVQGISKELKPKNLQDILDAGDAPLPISQSRFRSHTHGHESNNPTIPALVNVPTSETYTFAVACQRAWKEASKDDTNKVLVFRGLRVRMGIHAGVYNQDDVCYSKADSRTQYSGEAVIMARAVRNSGYGGMVLLSEETYKKLPLERLWDKYLILHSGEHVVQQNLPPLNLYHALNRTLEGRLAYLETASTINQLDPGVLDAPVGCITITFMNVVGAQTLLSWNADVAQHSLKVFHTVVGEELKRRKGYLVEAVDGLFLAAFQKPSEAILWALDCNEDMIKQEWPEELLSHELCEELVISAPTREGEVVNTVVFRGLRLKTGVDTGQVLGEVHTMTGRMTYRGKVMNRASRIASTASTGQVLCSVDSWNLAKSNDQAILHANKVTGTSLGQFRLKGVSDKMEVYHCRKVSSVTPARHTSSLVMMNEHWKWEQHVSQVLGPEDIILGPADSIRAAIMSPNSFSGDHTGSFHHDSSHNELPHCAVELSPEPGDFDV